MQVFEVIELKNYPYFQTIEITIGEKPKDIILNDDNKQKVYLLIDHDSKKIWTYNGLKSSFKLQVYSSILATMFRKQLKLFYRIFLLNNVPADSKEYGEVMNKPLSGGRARAIEESDFPKQDPNAVPEAYLKVDTNIRINKVLEYLYEIPLPTPEEFQRRLIIAGGNVYSEEIIPETFFQEENISIKPVKLGQLNNGFTFFDDHKYSTRLSIKDRKVQAIELFIQHEDKSPSLELDIPIIQESKFSNAGNIDDIMNKFQISDQLPEENKGKGELS